MLRLYTWAFALFFSTTVLSQPLSVPDCPVLRDTDLAKVRVSPDLFNKFVTIQSTITAPEIEEQYRALNRTVQHLNQKLKKSRSTEQFFKHFFYYVHRNYLKEYQQYATLDNLLKSGKYDCVSGTALYALLLDALHINFSVREMTYHMYLEIPLDGSLAIIESTDPLGGFISTESAVAERLAQYQAEEADPAIYSQPIQAKVGMDELLGLSYFNTAVFYYNQQQFTAARQCLRQAIHWYPADRMYAFRAIVEAVAAR
ncbi:MAG: hypothetical protein AAF944_00475 [Bacteroidota bacterium]